MINYLQNRFALSEQGAKGMQRAAWFSFLELIANMLPAILVLLFAQGLFNQKALSVSESAIATAGIIVIILIIQHLLYNALYTATYSECKRIRLDICETTKKLPMSYYYRHDCSDISQTITEDIAALEQAYSHAIPQIIGLIPFLIIISLMLLLGNLTLGLCIVIPTLITVSFVVLSKKIQRSQTERFYKQLRQNTQAFQQAIDMNKEIQSYNLTDKTKEDLDRRVEESERLHFKVEMIQGIFIILPNTIIDLSLGLVILFGAQLYMAGEINTLYLIGYLLAGAQIGGAIKLVFESIAHIFYIDNQVERIKELKSSAVESKKAVPIEGSDVCVEDVDFSYNSERKIIDQASFTAKENKVTALVGPSGCGKTTMLRLISKLYDYDSGEILIGNTNIQDVAAESVFDKISIVFQDVILFNASVYDNIKIGNENASEEEVLRAARLANCDEFALQLSDGYNTLIGENGCSLSGGERQRISIARAFLKNSPIIILDEIASNLDIVNENKIQEALQKLIKDKTVIIISHRMRSIENVDTIVVMNEGRTIASGTHDELMKTCEIYQAMVEKSRLTENFAY